MIQWTLTFGLVDRPAASDLWTFCGVFSLIDVFRRSYSPGVRKKVKSWAPESFLLVSWGSRSFFCSPGQDVLSRRTCSLSLRPEPGCRGHPDGDGNNKPPPTRRRTKFRENDATLCCKVRPRLIFSVEMFFCHFLMWKQQESGVGWKSLRLWAKVSVQFGLRSKEKNHSGEKSLVELGGHLAAEWAAGCFFTLNDTSCLIAVKFWRTRQVSSDQTQKISTEARNSPRQTGQRQKTTKNCLNWDSGLF